MVYVTIGWIWMAKNNLECGEKSLFIKLSKKRLCSRFCRAHNLTLIQGDAILFRFKENIGSRKVQFKQINILSS